MRHPDSLSAAEPLPADTDGTRTAELVKALLERIHYTKDRNIPTPVEGMWTSYFCSIDGDPCKCHLYTPAVTVMVSGRKRSIIGTRVYEYGAGDIFVTALDMPATWSVLEASEETPLAAVSVPLEREIIRELLPLIPPCPGSGCAECALIAKSDPQILDAFLRLLAIAGGTTEAKVLAPMIVREIHWRALSGVWGESLRRFFTSDSQSARIDSAVQWIRENFTEAFTVEELADRVHMAPSTFYRHFRAVTSLSPLQYQKQMRLHEARRLMLVKDLDAAHAAYSVGYASATQFSREFRRLFGQSPKQSLDGLRAGNVAAGPIL